MNIILMVVFAMASYALQNVLTERYFASVHPVVTMFWMFLPAVTLSGIILFGGFVDLPAYRPPLGTLKWIIIAAVFFMVGQILIFTAFKSGASAVFVTTSTILMPVFASIFRSVMQWGTPNRYTFLAWGFGVTTLIFASLSQLRENS